MNSRGKADFFIQPTTKAICVWTLPSGSKPVVRVEVEDAKIVTSKLYEIVCDTLQIFGRSRRFFGLFRGVSFPTKKYGNDETIYLPCKVSVSIQNWSFDVKSETRVIRTDTEAYRLLGLQVLVDIELQRFDATKEEIEELNEIRNSDFFSFKQFVDVARKLDGYSNITILDVEVVRKIKLVTNVLSKGTKINVTCSPRKMTLVSSK